jgi:His-Xaa-Ser system radical SAM maturase HxsC
MLGIPLYSELAHLHDYCVQADGAYDETVRGILNLKRHRVRVEIRAVLQRPTTERLPELARFIARNLLFVDHVALMGLEVTGFARANLDRLWIDPIDYAAELSEAVRILTQAGIKTSIYNSQLCVLPPELRRYARRSISDWKQEYLPSCDGCSLKPECAGFFATSGLKHSRAIAPILSEAA